MIGPISFPGGKEREPLPSLPETVRAEPATTFSLSYSSPESLAFRYSGGGNPIKGFLSWENGFQVTFDNHDKSDVPGNLLADIVSKMNEISSPDRPITFTMRSEEVVLSACAMMGHVARQNNKFVSTEIDGLTITATPGETRDEIYMRFQDKKRERELQPAA